MDKSTKIIYILEKAPKLGVRHKQTILSMVSPSAVIVKEGEGSRVNLDILPEEKIEQIYKYIEYIIHQLKNESV